MLIIQGSFAASVCVYAFIGYYLDKTGDLAGIELTHPASLYVKWALLAAAVLLYPILKKLQRSSQATGESRSLSPEKSRQVPSTLARNYFILFALCELPALFGLVLFLLGQPLKTLLLACGLSIFYLVSVTPPVGVFTRR